MSDPANGHPRDLLSGYLDDELSLEERASMDRHLAACEECREELEALRGLARALAGESVPPPPVDLEARIGRRLDAATIVRTKRWRFALPATIAATVGAIGLLVMLQWREGRIGAPATPAPEPPPPALNEAKPKTMPTPDDVPKQGAELQREKSATRVDALKKDLAATPEPKLERDAESAPATAPAGVPGGVVGGAVGGVASGVEGGGEAGTAAPTADQASAADERRERAAAKATNETRSPCSERWSDSGLRATWEVQDVGSAVRQLNVMARDVGGNRAGRGVVDGAAYVLVVPRARFEEVFFALRARGVTGLVEPPAVAAGNDCVGISIVLTAAVGPASPSPR